jgi:hypothetical protein
MVEVNILTLKTIIFFYLVKDQEIMAEFCSFKDQVANIFIKNLKIDLFLKFKKMMGMKKFEELCLKEGFNNYLNQVSM